MKTYILFLLGIFFISMVTAITVGTVYTQIQLDKANITMKLLTPNFETQPNGNLKIGGCRTDVDVCFAYITLGTTVEKYQEYGEITGEEIGEVKYKIVNKTIKLPFRTTKYYDIKQKDGIDIAFETLWEDLYPRAKEKVQGEVDRIKSYQTQELKDKENAILEIVDGQFVEAVAE